MQLVANKRHPVCSLNEMFALPFWEFVLQVLVASFSNMFAACTVACVNLWCVSGLLLHLMCLWSFSIIKPGCWFKLQCDAAGWAHGET